MKRKCVVILLFSIMISGCSTKSNISTPSSETNTQKETEDSTNNSISFQTKDELWDYLESTYPQVNAEQIASGNYKEEYVCIDAYVGDCEIIGDTMFFTTFFPLTDGSSTESNGMIDKTDSIYFSDASTLQDGDYIKLCVFVNADNSYGPIKSIALKKLSDKEKPSISLSSNPLIRNEFAIGDVMNGDNTDKIGEYGIVTIDKEVLKNISQDQFKEFIDKKVVDSGLNWVSIMCLDNTAIIFNGSNPQIGTYGECSSDGRVTKPYGYLKETTSGYKYEETTQ